MMPHDWLHMVIILMMVAFLLFGLFFLTVGAYGLVKLPDFYNRMHAASKCMTLGITGLLIAAAIGLSMNPDADPLHVVTKAGLVIIFLYIASPVGAHLITKAAHLDGAAKHANTLHDDLAEDQAKDR